MDGTGTEYTHVEGTSGLAQITDFFQQYPDFALTISFLITNDQAEVDSPIGLWKSRQGIQRG